MAIFVRCTEDIEKAISNLTEKMSENSRSQDNVAKKVFWLNVVLTTATVAGVVISLLKFMKEI